MTFCVCPGCLERDAEIVRLRTVCGEGAAALSDALDELGHWHGDSWGRAWSPDPVVVATLFEAEGRVNV